MSAVLTYWNGRGQAELVRMMLVVSGEEWTECVFGDKAEKNITTKEQMYRIQEAGVLAFDQVQQILTLSNHVKHHIGSTSLVFSSFFCVPPVAAAAD